ncbi:MAG: glycosyltransferase [Christensenellales bacterium]
MDLSIAQFIDGYSPVVDGVITVVKNYARILNQRYGKCCVIAPEMPGYVDDEPFDVYRFKSVKVPKREPYRTGFPSLDIEYRKIIKDVPLNILHAHSPFGAGLEALRMGKQLGIPVVATFHSKFYDDFKEVTKSDALAKTGVKYVVSFFNKADSVWTVNHSTVETLRSYGYKGDVRIMPNGVDVALPDDAAELAAVVKEKYQLGNETIFLFVGQVIWQKNIRLIADVMLEYKKLGHQFKMVYAGKGYADDEIRSYCRENGLGDDVIFTGMILDRELLRGLYIAADLFLFPSVYDNAPLVVREAAAMGTPSLLIRGSNSSEGIVDNENGFLCEENAGSMLSRILEIMDDRALLQKVSLGAKETLSRSWDSIMEEVYAAYLESIDEYRLSKKCKNEA